MSKIVVFSLLLYAFFVVAQTTIAQDTPKNDAEPGSMLSLVPIIELNTKKSLKEKEKEIEKVKNDGKENVPTKDKPKIVMGGEKKDTPQKNNTNDIKGMYKGIKGKKSFVRTTSGNKNIIENFSYVEGRHSSPAYVSDIFYFNTKKQRITKTNKFNPEDGFLLHGLYVKKVNELVQQEGHFYLGVKDGRWETYNKDTLMIDKKNYNKGFFDETIISYHDKNNKSIKEIISINYGRKEGDYFLFYPSGRMALKGQYAENNKIGMWYEYYDQVKFSRKREMKFPDDPFDKLDSLTIREWDIKGKILIDNSRNK